MIGPALAQLQERHPSVGEVRGLGVFWAIELVRDRETREPLVPFNAAGEAAAPMNEVVAACKAKGVWPFSHFNRIHVVPPCTIPVDDLRLGLEAIDEALTWPTATPPPSRRGPGPSRHTIRDGRDLARERRPVRPRPR